MAKPATQLVSRRLPAFPWDGLVPYRHTAAAHPDGVVDLSIGAPVDDVPALIQHALAQAANWPGYPTLEGSVELRQACIDWLERRFGVRGIGVEAVMPVTGSKELIGNLPLHLGLSEADVVVHPVLAYPTYEVGAQLVGATAVRADQIADFGETTPALVWINSPSNPTGRVASASELRKLVQWCRTHGVLLASDECYLELGWDHARQPVSVLHPDVCDSDPTGIITIHSLSKRSNLAGYRCAFAVGDPTVIAELTAVRKHFGLQLPGPQQQVMAAALADDTHVEAQHRRYAQRRGVLKAALEQAGFTIDHSEASLYLWATRGEDCWDTTGWLAERGIIVAPGEFYGPAGSHHVRVSITATDERVEAAAVRLRP